MCLLSQVVRTNLFIQYCLTFSRNSHKCRLDFRRLPGPVFDPPRGETALSGDERGLIFPNSGWETSVAQVYIP